jgi:streptogramin lyase
MKSSRHHVSVWLHYLVLGVSFGFVMLNCSGDDAEKCSGLPLPYGEICDDAKDNDCDGEVDEVNEGCLQNCQKDRCEIAEGQDEAAFVLENNRYDGVALDTAGNLVLDVSQIDLPFLWVANDADKTVSKIDTKSGIELARYDLGPECSSPSRTSVDGAANVWIGCREGSLNTRLVKIARDATLCVDKNGNGQIDTSSVSYDEQQLKTVTMLNWKEDECVLFNGTPVVTSHSAASAEAVPIPSDCNIVIRGLAVTSDNTVMVGGKRGCMDGHIWEVASTYSANLPYAENVNPGVEILNHWYLPDLEHRDALGNDCPDPGATGSYGMAIDQRGLVWMSTLESGLLTMLDPRQGRACGYPVDAPYGISIDYAGRIWLGNWWTHNSAVAYVFLPSTQTFFAVEKNIANEDWNRGTEYDLNLPTRGVVASTQANNPLAYLAISGEGSEYSGGVIAVKVINEDPAQFDARVQTVLRLERNGVCANMTPSCGVGLDGEGDLWLIQMETCGNSTWDNRDHNNAVALELDPKDFQAGYFNPQTQPETQQFIKRLVDTGSHSYTYSDFIGQQFATLIHPRGSYEQIYKAWGDEQSDFTTRWLTLNITLRDDIPSPRLSIAYRLADVKDALTSLTFSAETRLSCTARECRYEFPESPLGAYLDLKVILENNEAGQAPVVRNIVLQPQRVDK